MHVNLLTKRNIIVLPLSLIINACNVGPDFTSPDPPEIDQYTENPISIQTVATDGVQGGAAQKFNPGADIPARWWRLFHSPELNALIERGFKNNRDLRSAKATLRQAEELLSALVGSTQYPSVGIDVFGGREQLSAFDSLEGTPGATLSDFPVQLLSIYNANVSVAYVLDVFGGNRRAIESLKAQVEFQQYQVMAVYLSLAANIATTAINEASLRAQIAVLNEIIKIEEDFLKLSQQRFKIGSVTALDIYAQETALAEARAALLPLQSQLEQNRHALAILIGEYPSEAQLTEFHLEDLHLPTDLPVSVPSTLVEQRPDIQAAEALLHQATADIGVATANLLPSFPITGNYGANSDTLSDFFNSNNVFWSWEVDVLQTAFNGGALFAQRRAAIAAFEAALADYQLSVLTGVQNVADSLVALNIDAQSLKENAQAEKLAKETLQLLKSSYKIGGANYLDVLTAEMQYQQAVSNRIAAQASRYADTVALFQALGGGWWRTEK